MGEQFFSVELRVLEENYFSLDNFLFRREGCLSIDVLAKPYQHGNYKDFAPSLYWAS